MDNKDMTLVDIALAWKNNTMTVEQARTAASKLKIPIQHGEWPEDVWWEGEWENNPNTVLWQSERGLTTDEGYTFLDLVKDALPQP